MLIYTPIELVKDEEDWDPDAHDEAMGAAFNDEYYAQEEADRPVLGAEADIEDVEKWLDRVKERTTKGGKDVPNTDDIEKALDEYYGLEFEDDVAGEKTRFRYTKVAPQSYGLSNEELLNMSDDELDQLIPMKTLATYREDGGFIKRNKLKYKRMLLAKTRGDAKRSSSNAAKKSQGADHDSSTNTKGFNDKKRKRESLDGSEVKETRSSNKKKSTAL